MAQVTGRVVISLAGQRIRSKEGASLDIGGEEKEPVMSDSGVDGPTSKISAPKVDCKISHTAQTGGPPTQARHAREPARVRQV